MKRIGQLIELSQLRRSLTSSITTTWGVRWTAAEIARDAYQNFFDSNRDALDKIVVETIADQVAISAPALMNVEHAFFLGSTKSPQAGDIGNFGEGLKALLLCLLRDFGARAALQSGRNLVECRIGESLPNSGMKPLIYDFHELANEDYVPGTKLILENTHSKLHEAFRNAHLEFFHPEHPSLGPTIAGNHQRVLIAETAHGKPGAIFYRRLKRADLELPLIIAVNEPTATIEKLTGRDRDRNAFGDKLKEELYKASVNSRLFIDSSVVRKVLEVTAPFWVCGHPFLNRMLQGCGSDCRVVCQDLFGDMYFANQSSLRYCGIDRAKVREVESAWLKSGRKQLPSYFSLAGAETAVTVIEAQQAAARAEAERLLKIQQRGPTDAETPMVRLLEEALKELDAALARVVLKGVRYYVAETQDLLGAWQRSRLYRSKDIYLARSLFAGPFRTAFATHLHECSHLFGNGDGSRGFTDALTEMIETIARRPMRLRYYARQWKRLQAAVALEEQQAKAAGISVDAAVKLLSEMTLAQAQQAIHTYLQTREPFLKQMKQLAMSRKRACTK